MLEKWWSDFVSNVNGEKGEVVYTKPTNGMLVVKKNLALCQNIARCSLIPGASLEVWTGCYTSQCDKISLPASPAIHGNHSVSMYQQAVVAEFIVSGEPTLIFILFML